MYYAVIAEGRFNGVAYNDLKAEYVAHHAQYGELLVGLESLPEEGAVIDPEVIEASDVKRVRAERDRLLAACDWTQVLDAPLSPNDVAVWQAYRSALRDVPRQPGFPLKVEWPK